MNHDIKYWYLRNHQLFDQVSAKDIEELGIISNMKNAEKNETIYFSESEVKRLFFIKVGTVKICRKDETGRELITEMLTEGDIFGHLHPSLNSHEYAKAVSEKVKLCYFEIADFMELLKKHPGLSLKYANTINEKLLSFQQKYEDLVFKDVDTRVVDFFKRYATHHGKAVGNRVEMDMLLTHQDIADYTASSRQSVTTIINKLIDTGTLSYEGRKKVIIPDIRKLKSKS